MKNNKRSLNVASSVAIILAESLKQINLSENLREHTIFDKRPEQLSVDQFIDLTNLINQDLKH